jgi:hypothetical protein
MRHGKFAPPDRDGRRHWRRTLALTASRQQPGKARQLRGPGFGFLGFAAAMGLLSFL